jgi:hypothetical protein
MSHQRVQDVREDERELEKVSADEQNGALDFDPQVAKKLKRKADLILLPLLTVAYLLK